MGKRTQKKPFKKTDQCAKRQGFVQQSEVVWSRVHQYSHASSCTVRLDVRSAPCVPIPEHPPLPCMMNDIWLLVLEVVQLSELGAGDGRQAQGLRAELKERQNYNIRTLLFHVM